jgi:hypothetical protein
MFGAPLTRDAKQMQILLREGRTVASTEFVVEAA